MPPYTSFGHFMRALRVLVRTFAIGTLLAGCAVAAATTITYEYDEHGRMYISRSDNGTNETVVTYEYDNAGNRISTTSAIFDAAPPSVPTGLTASAVSYSQINLSWNPSTDTGGSGLAGYKVYRGGTHIGTTSATSYSDTTVFGSQTYSYTVAAYDVAQLTSGQSAPASATTPAAPDTTPPSVPTGLSASAPSSTQVNLSWSPSTDTGGSGLAGYRIYRNGAHIANSGTNSYSDTSTSGSTYYTYTVAAYDGASPANVSGQSAAVGVTTPDTLPPSVPSGLSASAPASGQVNLSWSASNDPGDSGVAGYHIYRGGAYIGSSSTTSFSDTSTAGSTYYTYTVAAYDNASNASAQSGAVGVTTPDTIAPTVPTGLTAYDVFATQVSLHWSASSDSGGSGLAGYKIYRNGSHIGSTSSTSYTDTTTSGNTSYTYTVASYDNSGNTSSPSAGASVTTPVNYIPITNSSGAILPAAAGSYSWQQSCGVIGGVIPYCDRYLVKAGVGTVWTWTYIYDGSPPPATCPAGGGASGYRQISGTCVIEASSSVY